VDRCDSLAPLIWIVVYIMAHRLNLFSSPCAFLKMVVFSLSVRGQSPVLILQAAIDWRGVPIALTIVAAGETAGETAPAMLMMLQSMVLCAADAGSGGAR